MSRTLEHRKFRRLISSACALFVVAALTSPLAAQGPDNDDGEIEREDGWIIRRDTTGTMTRTRQMTLHPKLEPVPALKYRLIPDEYERNDGNAAIFYLKAMGFLEEFHSREMLTKFQRDQAHKAEAEGKDNYPPYEWLTMHPRDLPTAEVTEFLQFVSFQEPILREASFRRNFSLDRNIKEVGNPIMYLLPEINQLREVARYQSIRFRLALAENRIDDAITYLGQNFSLAEHLGHDDFFVSSLVGIAIGAIAWNDALYLLERPDAPNLYWAFASLPKPMVSIQRAFAYERHMLFEQIKQLREIDEHPRNDGYWQDFIDRLIANSDAFELVLNANWNVKDMEKTKARALVATVVAAAYPGAKQYLVNDVKMNLDTVNAYPKAQTVFLALKIYSERTRDEQMKWQHVPYPLVNESPLYAKSIQQMELDRKRIGLITKPIQDLLPAVQAVNAAVNRAQQYVAMVQIIEAIRYHAATHNGRLPQSLANLELPVVNDPITGHPFEYRLNGNRAVLRGAETSGLQNQFILQIAN
ncbi:MAG: hypothetical protein KDB27_13730 [Planctomycetales bacterium]|nr:hypothetical protein [Planctomycetales bacterium]